MNNMIGVDVDPLMRQETLSLIRQSPSFSSKGDIIEHFNELVRGPLHEKVVRLMGSEVDIPWEWCLAAGMVVWWAGVAVVFSCENNRDCELQASKEGYSSLSQYLLGTAIMNMVAGPIFFVATFPLALRAYNLVATVAKGSQRTI